MVQLDWGYGISRCEVVEEVKAKQLSGGPEVFSIKIYLPVPVPTSPSLSSSIITSVHFISSSHHFHQNIPVNKHTIHHVQLRQWQGLHLRRVNRLGKALLLAGLQLQGGSSNAYRYSNSNGSYYYSNGNGSTYYKRQGQLVV